VNTKPTAAENNNRAVSFPVYLFKASAWCAAAFAFTGLLATYTLWMVPLTVIALSVPLAMGGIYRTTIRKIRFLQIFSHRGRIANIISGRLLPVLFWIFYAIVTSFFMLIGFQFFRITDWLLFLGVVPVFYMTYRLFFYVLTREIKTYLVTSMALSSAVLCTPFVMLAIYALITHGFDLPLPRYENLESAIVAHEETIQHLHGSALVKSASEWVAVYSGIRAYAAGVAGYGGIPFTSAAYLFFGGYIFFFNAANILTFCLVPARELKRILLPLSPEPNVALYKTDVRRCILYTSVISVFLLLLVAAFFIFETRFSERSRLAQYNTATITKVRQLAERIDGMVVRPGTITQIEAYKADMLRGLVSSAHELEIAIDGSFDNMIFRVDDFLDWYYSLFAEYARIAHMIGGSAEAHLSAMLAIHLHADENFENIRRQLDSLIEQHAGMERQLKDATRRLAEQNRIHETESEIEITREYTMEDLLDYEDVIGFDFRMLSASAMSGGGFLAGGFIGKKIVENVAKKSAFRVSARSLARFGSVRAAGRSGSGAAGAAAGAAAGSVVPGGGTAVGAAIGGITGSIAGGLLTDKALLMAEEHYRRETFKADIINAIETARIETKSRLYGL
jgi:hypothetical protein